ncbi:MULTISPECIES: D-alanine--D-alanine ligase family protein [unclassified Halanaerobium]|uniref:D-alanine--D-alanine ligase family protein n=1 Tax=unclassified Halanaerobium TaxID=2641197 RepID=UPI000DF1AC1F|nr:MULTISPECIES: D-alanine--D-alanine ligase family protein [unclassified Halanaerobium]RCW51371.1 D-alanine--D-alanine ligase [Halanaerobium sp. MA284_MarDTE_T2]RCW81430.1 D-alanine--D-alanine ligase [Halanaerobium sp. DL-01]
MADSKKNIALVFGGKSAEHRVSILSARSVFNAVDKSRYSIIPFAISKEGKWMSEHDSFNILDSDIMEAVSDSQEKIISCEIISRLQNDIDAVFPVLHGPFGEDGRIQGFFEILDIPYVGCGLTSSAVGMDKEMMKKIFSYQNLPQTDYMVIRDYEFNKLDKKILFQKISKKLGLPFFVKPANLGSSIGISVVKHKGDFLGAFEEGFKYDKKIIVEKKVSGREIECAVLGSADNIQVSSPGEIISKHSFYDYNAKYEDFSTSLIIPAELEKNLYGQLKSAAEQAFKAIDGKGLARVDFFIEDGNILINEINTMPGFTKYSMYPKLFEHDGILYKDLISRLIEISFT